jgi:hypothetical protein
VDGFDDGSGDLGKSARVEDATMNSGVMPGKPYVPSLIWEGDKDGKGSANQQGRDVIDELRVDRVNLETGNVSSLMKNDGSDYEGIRRGSTLVGRGPTLARETKTTSMTTVSESSESIGGRRAFDSQFAEWLKVNTREGGSGEDSGEIEHGTLVSDTKVYGNSGFGSNSNQWNKPTATKDGVELMNIDTMGGTFEAEKMSAGFTERLRKAALKNPRVEVEDASDDEDEWGLSTGRGTRGRSGFNDRGRGVGNEFDVLVIR